MPVGPPVPLRCETDLFRALGLHYVPPHMRLQGPQDPNA